MTKSIQLPVIVSNNTNMWAVIVDGRFNLFKTKAEATAVWDSVGRGPVSDELSETPFGSANLLPPGYEPNSEQIKWAENEGIAIGKLSDYRTIDIANYVKQRPVRAIRSYKPERRTARQKLSDRKSFEDIFGRLKK